MLSLSVTFFFTFKTSYSAPGVELVNVESVGIAHSRVVLCDSDAFGASLGEELGRPETDVAEALDDKRLVLDAWGELELVENRLSLEEIGDAVKDSEAGGLDTAGDTALAERLLFFFFVCFFR